MGQWPRGDNGRGNGRGSDADVQESAADRWRIAERAAWHAARHERGAGRPRAGRAPRQLRSGWQRPGPRVFPAGPGLPGAHMGGLGGLDQEHLLVRPDWRGAGESDPPADDSHRIADYVADLELLRRALGLQQMDLLGHSFGALVSLSYAAVHPDRVTRLVIDGARLARQGTDRGAGPPPSLRALG